MNNSISTSYPLTSYPRKSLAIFSLTSCEGCQFELLGYYDLFEKLLQFYDVHSFRLGQEDNIGGPYDVAIVEGNPDSEKQIKLLKEIRSQSKIVIAIGACAHMGGIQSERNRIAKKFIAKADTVSVPQTIKTDFIIPGCPISQHEFYNCLMDIYWDKKFELPDLAVCFECRLFENGCLLKKGLPCMGPITRMGCNAICIKNGQACLGCRGPIEQANFSKMRQILGTMLDEDEVDNWMTVYGEYEKISNNKTQKNK